MPRLFFGEPHIAGKYYYSDDMQGFNFERRRMGFAAALETIVSTAGRAGSPSVYLGSLPTDDYLPGFSAQNTLSVLGPAIAARIWLGHASNVSAHYDTLEQRRLRRRRNPRFTLFPAASVICMSARLTTPWRASL